MRLVRAMVDPLGAVWYRRSSRRWPRGVADRSARRGCVVGRPSGPPRPRRHVASTRELRAVHGRRAGRGGGRGSRPGERADGAVAVVDEAMVARGRPGAPGHGRPDLPRGDERHPGGRPSAGPAVTGGCDGVLRRWSRARCASARSWRRTRTALVFALADPVQGACGSVVQLADRGRGPAGCGWCRASWPRRRPDLRARPRRRHPASGRGLTATSPGRLAGSFAMLSGGEVSEWLMVPLSKSGVRKHRGFESRPLRHRPSTRTRSAGSSSTPAERSPSGRGRRTGNAVWGNPSRVRIPPSPPLLRPGVREAASSARRATVPACPGRPAHDRRGDDSCVDRQAVWRSARCCRAHGSRVRSARSGERVGTPVRFGAKLTHSTQPDSARDGCDDTLGNPHRARRAPGSPARPSRTAATQGAQGRAPSTRSALISCVGWQLHASRWRASQAGPAQGKVVRSGPTLHYVRRHPGSAAAVARRRRLHDPELQRHLPRQQGRLHRGQGGTSVGFIHTSSSGDVPGVRSPLPAGGQYQTRDTRDGGMLIQFEY